MAHPFQKYRDSERTRAKQYQSGGVVSEDKMPEMYRPAAQAGTAMGLGAAATKAMGERMRADEAQRRERSQALESQIERPGVPRKRGGKA